MGDFTEPARMLSETMDDSDGPFGIGRCKFGVVKSYIIEFGVQVLFLDDIVFLFELSKKTIFLHGHK